MVVQKAEMDGSERRECWGDASVLEMVWSAVSRTVVSSR